MRADRRCWQLAASPLPTHSVPSGAERTVPIECDMVVRRDAVDAVGRRRAGAFRVGPEQDRRGADDVARADRVALQARDHRRVRVGRQRAHVVGVEQVDVAVARRRRSPPPARAGRGHGRRSRGSRCRGWSWRSCRRAATTLSRPGFSTTKRRPSGAHAIAVGSVRARRRPCAPRSPAGSWSRGQPGLSGRAAVRPQGRVELDR